MKIVITGEFTEEDLKEFAKVLRKVERNNPNETYFLIIEDKDLKLKEASELVARVFKSIELGTGG